MSGKKRHWQGFAVALAAILVLTLAPAAGAEGESSFRIIPPHSAKAQSRMSYAEWSAVWWQWVLSINAANNPLLDETGATCGVAQPRGQPVFFLVGAFGSGTVTRDECVVPAGKLLFFPLVNAFWLSTEPTDPSDPAAARELLMSVFGPVTALWASVDGEPVSDLDAPARIVATSRRSFVGSGGAVVDGIDPNSTPFHACAGGDPSCSPAWSLTVPDDNNLFGLPAGAYGPGVADGYYLMLAPLRPGNHTIRFGATFFWGPDEFTQDITYNVVVQ